MVIKNVTAPSVPPTNKIYFHVKHKKDEKVYAAKKKEQIFKNKKSEYRAHLAYSSTRLPQNSIYLLSSAVSILLLSQDHLR